MRLVINNSDKAEKFSIIWRNMKQFSGYVAIYFKDSGIYVQGMDSSHICLFELKIDKDWFDEYEFNEDDMPHIAVSTSILSKVILTRQQQQQIEWHYEGESDTLNINFESKEKEEYNKYFNVSLITLDQELLNVEDQECDVDMVIPTKKIGSIVDQLVIFDEIVQIICSESVIELISAGDEGSMKVNLDIDDLLEYAISEDLIFKQTFSLKHFQLITQFIKLSVEAKIGFRNDGPMEMLYDLDNKEGDESSVNYLRFYLAPKIDEE